MPPASAPRTNNLGALAGSNTLGKTKTVLKDTPIKKNLETNFSVDFSSISKFYPQGDGKLLNQLGMFIRKDLKID
jgi:hypothetical protein